MKDKINYVGGRKKCKQWMTRKEKRKEKQKECGTMSGKEKKIVHKRKFENNF